MKEKDNMEDNHDNFKAKDLESELVYEGTFITWEEIYLAQKKVQGRSLEVPINLLEKAIIVQVAREFPKAEPWEIKWFSRPLAFLLSKEHREEWLGDLVETRYDLLKEGYPRWMAFLITVARSGLLVWSFVRIRYQDLVSPSVRKKQD